MISLKDNLTALINLPRTIEAIGRFDEMIVRFSSDKAGLAYMTAREGSMEPTDFQLDRDLIVPVLKAQRQRLVDYLATLGIEVDARVWYKSNS